MKKKQVSSKRQLRVAFKNLYNPAWVAGENYLVNLFLALKSLDKSEQPEIILVSSEENHHALDEYVDCVLPFETDPETYKRVRGLPWKTQEAYFSQFLQQNGVDCLFLKGSAGKGYVLPVLSWIADFQFLRLPEMFSSKEIEKRIKIISQAAKYSDRIIVSSQDAQSDFEKFSPKHASKTRVLPFVAHVPERVYNLNPASVCELYGLPERFFYLPNQFFKHKNHQVIIDAMTLLKEKSSHIVVVCTGHGDDFRHLGYYESLMREIAHRKLESQFVHIGLVPQEHVYLLMRQSLAVLQPSLFEGWSTSVEETKSLGKSVVLSDIPVLREQNPPHGIFFDPHQPEQLAHILIEMHLHGHPGPDISLEELARNDLRSRSREFGRRFMRIVEECA